MYLLLCLESLSSQTYDCTFMKTLHSLIKEALFGVAVGDALGVPVEFSDRSSLMTNPVTGMGG